MKKIAVIILTTILFTSCCEVEEKQVEVEFGKPKRIIEKEIEFIFGNPITIIEVDGTEYLVTARGGICPLVRK